LERRLTSAHQSDLDRVTQADPRRVEVDLNGTGLSRPGVELDVRERAADDQERVAIFERILRWSRAEEADTTRGVRAIVGHDRLTEERLDDGRPKKLGDLLQVVARTQSALAGEDGDLPSVVQDIRRPFEVVRHRQSGAPGVDLRNVMRNVPRRSVPVSRRTLNVDRNRQVAHATAAERGATGKLRHVLDVARPHDPLVIHRDILK